MKRIIIKLLKILLVMTLALVPVRKYFLTSSIFPTNRVFAETEEEEEEHEDEDRNEDDDEEEERRNEEVEYEYITIPSSTVTTLTETIQVLYTTVDAGYDIDSDGDKLVDAIDPNPQIPQNELFTDDDKDSVPNATDMYKGEDDFSYLDFEDTNSNGIADLFE